MYTETMKRSELCVFLEEYLDIDAFSDIDPSTNGLVVGAPEDKEIKKVAVAVDANLSTFHLALEWGADMLFTHHGLFWGHPLPVTGVHYTRIKTLLEGNLDLYVCHLPLDAHGDVGNNVQMAKILGLSHLKTFAPYKGKNLGWWGMTDEALTNELIAKRLGFYYPFILPYGKKEIHTVGFVSGAGSDDVDAAMELGLDCFVTGVAQHEQFSDCVEGKMNMVAGGHYDSEVFGVKAVGKLLSEKYGLETKFLSDPSGL
jgi:dinuclear metal center YbgI/SA1388 family protein